jgi:hypothetical protein
MNNPDAETRGILPQTCPPLRSLSLAGRLHKFVQTKFVQISETCLPARQVCSKKTRNPEAELQGILLIK